VNRDQKQTEIEELHEAFGKASAAYLTNFTGIRVEALNKLRVELNQIGVSYRVVKNTLARKALQGTNLTELGSMFEGPTAVAFATDDPVAPAKVLKAYRKDNEKLVVKGGYLDGRIFGASDLDAIAALPGRDELRSAVLSVIIGVPRGIVTILNEIPTGFVRVLDARREQLEETAN